MADLWYQQVDDGTLHVQRIGRDTLLRYQELITWLELMNNVFLYHILLKAEGHISDVQMKNSRLDFESNEQNLA